MSPMIEVKNLTVQYHDKVILDNISFHVNRGEIFIILGGSGSGKTTLLKQMIGLEKPFNGDIFLDQENIVTATFEQRNSLLKKIGVMYQSGALFGSMTLLENVALPLEELTELPRDAIDFIARNKLGLVGLADFCEYMPDAISGGMRKRAAIARAMALDPNILFLDEPSAGLDPITSAQLDRLILDLSKALGITFVIVSHELSSIYEIADRVIMLHRGTIVAEGDPKMLSTKSDLPFVKQFFHREL